MTPGRKCGHQIEKKGMAMNFMTNNIPLSTSLDMRRGITSTADVAFPLRCGILDAGDISARVLSGLI